MKTLIVDTTATNQKYKFSVCNLGAIVASKKLNADLCNWRDNVDVSQYQTIGFSVLWPPYALNIAPFLKRHHIPPLKIERQNASYQHLIAGGQGATNINHALDNILDVYYGEIEDDYIDSNNFHRANIVDTDPVIYNNNRHAAIELTRGCKHRCKFCEYAHVLGGKYREKPIDLFKEQLKYIQHCSIKQVQFRTANLASLSYLEEFSNLVANAGIYTRTADITIKDAHSIIPCIKRLRVTHSKIGVESFDEKTRFAIGKDFTDEYLYEVIRQLAMKTTTIYFFLIYGLPGDNYDNWFTWLEKLQLLRFNTPKTLRYCFSICNFRPVHGTPMENEPHINFQKKYTFIKQFTDKAKQLGFYREDWDVTPGQDCGRFGRTEPAHLAIEAITTKGPARLTPILIKSVGTGRYISKAMAKRLISA